MLIQRLVDGFCYLNTLGQLMDRKFVRLEQLIELFSKIECMTWVAETDFLVLWAKINDRVKGTEIDWLIVEKHSIDCLSPQNLFGLKRLWISMRHQNIWFRSRHEQPRLSSTVFIAARRNGP